MIRPDSLPRQLVRFAPKYFLGLAYSAWLFSVGVFSARHREFIWQLCKHFGHRDKATAPLLPVTPLDEFFADAGPLEIVAPAGVNGNVTHLELLSINLLVKRRQPRRMFEIGTFDGRTSLNLAANAPEGHLFTLDLPAAQLASTALEVEAADVAMIDKACSGSRVAGTPQAGRITQLYGDSANFDYSPYLGNIDAVFVDGSHAYDYVKNDAEVALKLLSPAGGVIIFHDYTVWDGVTRALNELAAVHPVLKGLRHLEETSLAYLVVAG